MNADKRRYFGIVLASLIAILLATGFLVRDSFARNLRVAAHTLAADATELGYAADANFGAVVQLLTWHELEPTRDQFIWQPADEAVAGAEYYGLDFVARLDKPPAWARPAEGEMPVDLAAYDQWIRTVVTRYRGRIPAYIIWNEPNLALEWNGQPPDAAAYVKLLEVGYRAVKESDPNALVVSGGLAPTNTQNDEALDDRLFLRQMYEAGAASYFDVLGAHAYGFGYPPADPRGAHDGLNLARTEDLRDIMLEYNDGDKPVWITEMGWTVQGNEHSRWQEVSEAQQAEYLVGALDLIERDWPWVELATVWNIERTDNPDWVGYDLINGNTPRPAYFALQDALSNSQNRRPTTNNQQSTTNYQLLAPDSTIHLGDAVMPVPWVPLHDDRNPSPEWSGTVYIRDEQIKDDATWRLRLTLMQSNYWSNRVWVNGEPLAQPMPLADFSKSWVAHAWNVPGDLLQPGPNEIRVTLAHAVPLIQAKSFAYDEVQIKDAQLWKE